VKEAISCFVNRKLVMLWEQSSHTASLTAVVQRVHLATNRIEVDLAPATDSQQTIGLTWEEQRGKLWARAEAAPWANQFNPTTCEALLRLL